MKTHMIIAVALLGACSKDALKDDQGSPDAAVSVVTPSDTTPTPINAETGSPEIVYLPEDAHPAFDFDARPETTINRDVRRVTNIPDEGCAASNAWLFIEENDSLWCGSVLDACEAICHSRDCTVHREVGGLQVAYCPKKK